MFVRENTRWHSWSEAPDYNWGWVILMFSLQRPTPSLLDCRVQNISSDLQSSSGVEWSIVEWRPRPLDKHPDQTFLCKPLSSPPNKQTDSAVCQRLGVGDSNILVNIRLELVRSQ